MSSQVVIKPAIADGNQQADQQREQGREMPEPPAEHTALPAAPRIPWIHWADTGLAILFLLWATVIAIVAVSEVSGRDSFLRYLDRELETRRATFMQRFGSSAAAAESKENPALATIRRESEILEDIIGQTRLLATLGASSEWQTIAALRQDFRIRYVNRELQSEIDVIEQRLNEMNVDLSRAQSRLSSATKDDPALVSQISALKSVIESLEKDKKLKRERSASVFADARPPLFASMLGAIHPSWLSTDYLLAIAIMSAAALGAIVVGLRSKAPTSIRDVGLGLASGFICFLAIKGGKHLFVLELGAEPISFNPYGAAFAGVLVGLFSERAYRLLSALVDDLSARVSAATTAHRAEASQPAGARNVEQR